MKTGLIALMLMLSVTLVIGGMTPQAQLGTAVDDVVSETIYGGGCAYKGTATCPAGGGCSSATVTYFSGSIETGWEHDTSVNCGAGSSCVSHTKDPKKCGG